jgi:UPF0755 protein
VNGARVARVLASLVLAAGGGAVVAAAILLGVTQAQLQPYRRGEAPDVVFEVRPGSSLGAVARDLEAAGIVRSARATAWLARWLGVSSRLKAGEYEISAAMWPREILELFVSGRVKTYEVTLPEGIVALEVARRVESAGIGSASELMSVFQSSEVAAEFGVEGPTLEGYLFPETYRFARGVPAREQARTIVGQFLSVWKEIAPLAAEQGLSMREVVTLASIVERETGAPEERPRVAAVFRNRLAQKMRLESDPTVIYGLAAFDGNLRREHLEDASNPYNTYQIVGLPPGPIANPGAASLRAVVQPEPTDYLYFVSRNDGTHHFSRTLEEHVSAVNNYQRKLTP